MQRMCFFRCGNWTNPVEGQRGQRNGFSPVWRRKCSLSAVEWENAWRHTGHLYGLSPEWVRRCTVNCERWANLALQSGHAWGFSRKWVRRCCKRCPLRSLRHTLQWKDLKFPWRQARCFCRPSRRAKVFPHSWHTWSRCPKWRLRWVLRLVAHE